MTEKGQLEELAEWLATCPTKTEPICYLIGRYKDIQILYSDMVNTFPDAKVEEGELATYHRGIRIFCLMTDEQAAHHTNWEEMV
jgi:hypothetical protein